LVADAWTAKYNATPFPFPWNFFEDDAMAVCLKKDLLFLLALTSALPLVTSTRGAERVQEERANYIRVQRNEDGRPISFDTAIISFGKSENGDSATTVDLIAAVHVADKEYYDKLNKLFEKYDVVLYELVAPEGTRIARGGGGTGKHPVSALQLAMKSVLDLGYQLEEIDYTKQNLVHADFSLDEFAQSMKDRGESPLQMFFRMMGHAMALQSRGQGRYSDSQLLFAILSKDRARKLKQIMAELLGDMESTKLGLDGPDGSTIITERNKRAIEVFERQVARGHKKIGIFYGSMHMPDMERRLREQFKMAPIRTQWLTAWEMSDGGEVPE
jgi:hypothetical protein